MIPPNTELKMKFKIGCVLNMKPQSLAPGSDSFLVQIEGFLHFRVAAAVWSLLLVPLSPDFYAEWR